MKRRFFVKFTIFLIPILAYVVAVMGLGLWFGDLIPISEKAKLQIARQATFHFRGSQEDLISYKLQMTLQQRPQLLVMGSSRFFYMSSAFVTQPDVRFYNAAIPAFSPTNALEMISILSDHDAMPEVLIINFDLPWFNADRVDFRREEIVVLEPNLLSSIQRMIEDFQTLALDMIKDPKAIIDQIQAVSLQEINTIGRQKSNGIAEREGYYKADGSLLRIITPERVQSGMELHEYYLQKGEQMYEIGSGVDEDLLAAVQEMLAIAQENDTLVIGVLLPYHPDFYHAMQGTDEFDYLSISREAIADKFSDANMIFQDYSDPAKTHVQPNMFYDGWHLAEVGTLSVYVDLVTQYPDILANYSDITELNQLLAHAYSSFDLDDSSLP